MANVEKWRDGGLVFIGDGVEESLISLVMIAPGGGGGALVADMETFACMFVCSSINGQWWCLLCHLALDLDLRPTVYHNLSLCLEALVLLSSLATSTIISSFTWSTTSWVLSSLRPPNKGWIILVAIDSL